MDFVDSAGTRYQLTETAEAPPPAPKKPVWPWLVGGLALAGGLLWMASSSTRKPNPITPKIEALIAKARDPNTSRDRLWKLFSCPHEEVKLALLDNPNLCPTKDGGKPDASLLQMLAREFPEEVANLPVFVLYALIEPDDDFEGVVRNVVSQISDTGLIEHAFRTWGPSSWNVRLAVAENPNTPLNILPLLGNPETEPIPHVRKAVASNPSTPEHVLRILGSTEIEFEWSVRKVVALNPHTPTDVLRALGNQKIEPAIQVREAVASNPSTPEDLLRTLANKKTESKWTVRKAAKEALAARGLA